MNQQINLYQIKESPEPVVITFMRMVQVMVIFLVILSGISCYKFLTYYQEQIKFTTIQVKKELLQRELTIAQTKLPKQTENEKLMQQIAKLEATGLQMQEMQATLNKLQAEKSLGFSDYMEALAKYKVPELWLTSFKFAAGGSMIWLSGKTTNAANVPKLLENLGKDPVFLGKTYESLKIYSIAKEKLINFTIGSE